MTPQGVDELTNIWNTFRETSFEPSVSYLVSPVVIDSERERTITRVREREEQYYVGSEDE